jgi:hypothetical protein
MYSMEKKLLLGKHILLKVLLSGVVFKLKYINDFVKGMKQEIKEKKDVGSVFVKNVSCIPKTMKQEAS